MNYKHIYQDITGWTTFEGFYSDVAKHFPDGSTVVEVGTYSGRSFGYLCVEMLNVGKTFDLHAADSYTFNDEKTGEPILDAFIRNLSPLPVKINIIKGQSWESAELFEDESVDFCFLDADHVYKSVLKDIKAWLPKIKPGGWLAGHDLCSDHPGVEKAVKEVFGDSWSREYVDQLVWKYER